MNPQAKTLMVSGANDAKQAIIFNLIAAHKTICTNATARDVKPIKRLTRVILRLVEQFGDKLIYFVPEKEVKKQMTKEETQAGVARLEKILSAFVERVASGGATAVAEVQALPAVAEVLVTIYRTF